MADERQTVDRETYEAPTVRELGTIDEFTLGDTDSVIVTLTEP